MIAAAVTRIDRTEDLVSVSNDATIVEVEIWEALIWRPEDLKADELDRVGKTEEGFWLRLNLFAFDDKAYFHKAEHADFKDVKKSIIEELLR